MLPWMAVCCTSRPTCRWCFILIVSGTLTHMKESAVVYARSKGRNADTLGKSHAKEGALFEAILSLSSLYITVQVVTAHSVEAPGKQAQFRLQNGRRTCMSDRHGRMLPLKRRELSFTLSCCCPATVDKGL